MLNSVKQRKENLSNLYKQIGSSSTSSMDPERHESLNLHPLPHFMLPHDMQADEYCVPCLLFLRESLLGGSDSNGFNRGRVLGKPQETEITRGLDNQGLVAYQRETISGGWKEFLFSLLFPPFFP